MDDVKQAVAWTAFIIALCFLFVGEPDVFDSLQNKIINQGDACDDK